jgi:putative lipoprotein (rSAM/lipoprotein system)
MWFDVEGSVVNEADEPIEGISVYAESADPVLTGTDGGFSIRGGGMPAETTVLRFIDNDITDNVSYISKSVTVDLVKYKDGQGWTEGYYKNRDKLVVVMTEAAEITPSNPDVEASPEAWQ